MADSKTWIRVQTAIYENLRSPERAGAVIAQLQEAELPRRLSNAGLEALVDIMESYAAARRRKQDDG